MYLLSMQEFIPPPAAPEYGPPEIEPMSGGDGINNPMVKTLVEVVLNSS